MVHGILMKPFMGVITSEGVTQEIYTFGVMHPTYATG